MKARYAVINENHRNWFEKEFQLPYGYSNCFLTFDLNEALEKFRNITNNFSDESWVIEKIDEYGRDIIYRD